MEAVDVTETLEQRIAVIKAHHSQQLDAEAPLTRCLRDLEQGRKHVDYFIVRQ